MNAQAPKVSVVIPFHNRIAWTIEAVESVLAQTLQDFEIILVDDGSTEKIGGVLDMSHLKIRYVRHTKNRGPSASRNRGIDESRGQYIAFLDSDDRYVSSMLEEQVAALDRNPDIFLSHASFHHIDAEGKKLREVHSGRFSGYVFPKIFFEGSPISCSGVFLRKAALQKGDRFPESVRFGEDVILWHRLSKRGPILGIDKILAEVRMHGENTVLITDRMIEGINNVFNTAIHTYIEYGWFFTARLRVRKHRTLARLYLRKLIAAVL